MIQLVDDGYHIVRLSGPVIMLFSKLKFLLYGHVMYILIGLGLLMLHEGSTLNLFYIKIHFITTTRHISILLNM